MASDLRAAWDAASVDERRELVRLVLSIPVDDPVWDCSLARIVGGQWPPRLAYVLERACGVETAGPSGDGWSEDPPVRYDGTLQIVPLRLVRCDRCGLATENLSMAGERCVRYLGGEYCPGTFRGDASE